MKSGQATECSGATGRGTTWTKRSPAVQGSPLGLRSDDWAVGRNTRLREVYGIPDSCCEIDRSR